MKKESETKIELLRKLLEQIPLLLEDTRKQRYAIALRESAALVPGLERLLQGFTESSNNGEERNHTLELQERFGSILVQILQTQEEKDYILMADYYELLLLPFLKELQEQYLLEEEENQKTKNKNQEGNRKQKIAQENFLRYAKGLEQLQKQSPGLAKLLSETPNPDAWEKEGYQIERASSGAYTVSVLIEEDPKSRRYLHSNHNPGWEARQLATAWYEVEKQKYAIVGLGLGYPVSALLALDPNIQIFVYESRLTMLKLALAYGTLTDLLEEGRVRLVYDPEGTELRATLVKEKGIEFVPFSPSIATVQNKEFRQWLELRFMEYQSMQTQIVRLMQNFRENCRLHWNSVEELKKREIRKRFFLIAAGPSLDKNYLELKKKKPEDVILATGPVLKKLLQAGIEPDYVVVSESSKVYKKRLEGLKEAWKSGGLKEFQTSLLFLSTASSEYVKKYPGEKYLLCQRGFEPAERLAKEQGCPLVETGGSVAVVALSAAILLGAKEVVFVGQDLAYTGNQQHALGTSAVAVKSEEGFGYERTDLNGNPVRVPQNLELFRVRLEQMVAKNPQVKFWNATEGGVPIKGVPNVKLEELFD